MELFFKQTVLTEPNLLSALTRQNHIYEEEFSINTAFSLLIMILRLYSGIYCYMEHYCSVIHWFSSREVWGASRLTLEYIHVNEQAK